GKRVYIDDGNTKQFSFYNIGGQKLITVSCSYNRVCDYPKTSVYFGGKVMRNGNAANAMGWPVMTDRLGSVRANSNPATERFSYYPYGEERTTTADGREKFATYTRDSTAGWGQDYADQRYYTVGMGRFYTPDPSYANVNPINPASWNRYAYVNGD